MNCYEIVMEMNELDKEIMELNEKLRVAKITDNRRLLEEEIDRKYVEFLILKHKLQDIKL